jgi:hypothetical protein
VHARLELELPERARAGDGRCRAQTWPTHCTSQQNIAAERCRQHATHTQQAMKQKRRAGAMWRNAPCVGDAEHGVGLYRQN